MTVSATTGAGSSGPTPSIDPNMIPTGAYVPTKPMTQENVDLYNKYMLEIQYAVDHPTNSDAQTRYITAMKGLDAMAKPKPPALTGDLDANCLDVAFTIVIGNSQFAASGSKDSLLDLSKVNLTTLAGSTVTTDKYGVESFAVFLTHMHGADFNEWATRSTQDIVTEFGISTFKAYTKAMEEMNNALQVSKDIINDTKAIEHIINQKEPVSGKFSMDPKSLDDIDPLLQQDIKAKLNNPNATFADMQKFIKDNPDQYASMIDKEFGQNEITYKPLPISGKDMQTLIDSRDDLTKQMKILDDQVAAWEKKGSVPPCPVEKGYGSQYDQTKKLLDQVNKYVPPDQIPPGSKVLNSDSPNWKIKVGIDSIPAADIQKKYLDPMIMASVPKKGVTGDLADAINGSFTASQNLSQKQTDDLKAKNVTLNQICDMVAAMQKDLDQIIKGGLQKISRG